MNKILVIMLAASTYAASLFAQTSNISGVWERNSKAKEIKLFRITESGDLKAVSHSAIAPDGTFNMSFAPEREGYFVLGLSAARAQNRYIFYLKPGDPLNVKVTADSYQLVGKNTEENKEMARWHDFVFPLEDKAVYFQGKRSTFVDFFPLMEEKLKELSAYKAKKTKNKTFNVTFADFRQYDLLFYATQFIYSVRSKHPQKADFIDYYRQIDVPALSRTTGILRYPDGARILVNAYMIHTSLSVSDQEHTEMMKNPAETLLGKDTSAIGNDTIKGEIMLMFCQRNKTKVGLEEYKKEYGSFLVTDGQKKRWQHIEDSFEKNMAKKETINFSFPDANGHEVSITDFRGKVVYIDIWATWCGPCKKEMPAMKALEAEYKDNKDIVFMGVSVDTSKNIQKWKDFLVKEQLPGVQLFAGDMAGPTLSKPYKITGIPRFMLVGKDGNLIYADAPRPSSPEIRAVLNAALK